MNHFLTWLCATLIRLLGSTLRFTVEDRAGILNHPDRPPVIGAFWHNRVGLMPYIYERYERDRRVLMFISRSRDGQFITDVAARFGIEAVRGSSSRHGMAAALAALRASEDQRVDIGITPDGPRGPRYQIQPGLIRLAQITQRPIVTITYHLGWKYELRSWDRFQIPLPFSTCRLVIEEPIHVPPDATEEQLHKISAKLTQALIGELA